MSTRAPRVSLDSVFKQPILLHPPLVGRVKKKPTLRRPYYLCGRRVRPYSLSPSTMREWRAEGRFHYSECPRAICGARAPLGAPVRRLPAAGPRFRRLLAPRDGRASALLGTESICPGKANGFAPSASSSRQVLLPAGGAPAPPERDECVSHRPRAPHSTPPSRRLMTAPLVG